MKDPRTCPHCGDTPATDSRCGCGWVMQHGHKNYTAALERENAELRAELDAIKSGKTAEMKPGLGAMWTDCPFCDGNFMLHNLTENGGKGDES